MNPTMQAARAPEAILERIRKLLRMKNGGTPDEVAKARADCRHASNSQALMRIDQALVRREEFMAQRYGEQRTRRVGPRNRPTAATWRGYLAGLETKIPTGVGGPASRRQLNGERLTQETYG